MSFKSHLFRNEHGRSADAKHFLFRYVELAGDEEPTHDTHRWVKKTRDQQVSKRSVPARYATAGGGLRRAYDVICLRRHLLTTSFTAAAPSAVCFR